MTRQAITELDPDQVRIEVRALLAPLGRRLWQREAQALPMPRASAVCRHRIEARPRWLLRRQVLLNDERPINLVMKGRGALRSAVPTGRKRADRGCTPIVRRVAELVLAQGVGS